MRIAKIQGKGEAFQISKLDGMPELNKLFKKKRVSEFPDKEKWGAKLYFDTVEISEKVGWIGQNNPSALVEDFISIDLDHDGDKDWLVFLYGFTLSFLYFPKLWSIVGLRTYREISLHNAFELLFATRVKF